MDDDDILIIDDDEEGEEDASSLTWRVLLVDDEPEIHQVTKVALGQFEFEGRPLVFLHAHSGKEACEIMDKEEDVAMILLDVVMEHDHAGLDVVKHVRDKICNSDVRIVLRTGQPGQAPEDDVVESYDINDYKDKTELTSQKLRTLLRAGLRSYRDIRTLERSQIGLERVISGSKAIFAKQLFVEPFAQVTLAELLKIVNLDNSGDFVLRSSCFQISDTHLECLTPSSGEASMELSNASPVLQRAVKEKASVFEDDEMAMYCDNDMIPLVFSVHIAHPLSKNDQDLISVFKENVMTALDNIRLNQVIEDNQREIMYRVGEIVETRSKESGLHVKRVALYTELLCELMGMDEETIEEIKRASPLHDIGKVGIPDAVLNKPAKLDQKEWEIMKSHTQLGHDMLAGSSIPLFEIGARIAANHHEKWDGSGYPLGTKGESIPIEGRVVALADVFDALGSDRCYKKAWPLDKILKLLEEEKGKHFDPELVDLMLGNMDRFIEIRDAYKDEFIGDS